MDEDELEASKILKDDNLIDDAINILNDPLALSMAVKE